MPKNTSDTEVLNSLYKNASMGKSSINAILPKVDDPKLKSELKNQLNNYETHCADLSAATLSKHSDVKDVGFMQKAYADAGIMVSTMINSTPSHIAEMMVQGTNMGIIDITKTLNTLENVSNDVKSTADKMLHQEQAYIDKLKMFL